MNRRQFIIDFARYGISAGLLGLFPLKIFAAEKRLKPGMRIIDAHAHPYSFYRNQIDPNEHTFEMIREAGIVATSFAAVGDYAKYSTDAIGPPYLDTLRQLAMVQEWEDRGFIKIIRNPQQIPRRFDLNGPINALLTIEGGDALEGHIDHLDEFYNRGVRIITLVHNNKNEIGSDMRQFASNSTDDPGLTDFGYRVVERMNELGILIDVAHSSAQTVYDVAGCTRAPIIDSHTNPLPPVVIDRGPGRLRTYSEIEAIVETGGVICTWPLAYGGTYPRLSFQDWAQEIKELKKHFDISHVGLGTDSGGGLPDYVEGWNDITELNLLGLAMLKEGFEKWEIAAFMGSNLLRVLHSCFEISHGK